MMQTPVKDLHAQRMTRSSRESGSWTFWISSPMGGLLFVSLYIASLFLSKTVVLSQPLAGPGSIFYFFGGIVILVLLMTALLFVFGKSAQRQSRPISLDLVESQWTALLQPLALLALLGAVAVMADFAISLRYGQIDFVTLRETFGERKFTPLSYLANLLGPFSIFTLGLTIVCYERLTSFNRCLGLLAGILTPVVGSVGLAGRGGIVELTVWAFWWLLQRPMFNRPILPKAWAWRVGLPIVFAGVVLLLGMIGVRREGGFEARHEAVINFNRNAVTPAPWLLAAVENTSPVVADVITEGIFYWTGPIAVFDKIYYDWNFPLAPFSAFSPILGRRLTSIGISPSSMEIWDHQSQVLLSYGIYPNMFLTNPGTLIIALGRIGGFIVQLGMAVLSCYIFTQARARKDFILLNFSGIFFLWFTFWFQKSIFIYPMYEYSAYLLILGLFFRPRQSRNSSTKNPGNPSLDPHFS